MQLGVFVASGAPEVSARAVLDQWSLIQQVAGGGAVQNGLLGVYFSRADLTLPVAARVDGTVDFDWSTGSPHAALGGDEPPGGPAAGGSSDASHLVVAGGRERELQLWVVSWPRE